MFEWHLDKGKANLAKHGVSFEDAAECFDGFLLEKEDTGRPYGEQRIIALGATKGVVLAIIYTYRGNRIRIISARKATRHERKTYVEAAIGTK